MWFVHKISGMLHLRASSSDRGCKILIPDILRVKSSNYWTYGSSPPRSGLVRCGPDSAGNPFRNDASLILGASLIIRAVSSKSVDNRGLGQGVRPHSCDEIA